MTPSSHNHRPYDTQLVWASGLSLSGGNATLCHSAVWRLQENEGTGPPAVRQDQPPC